MREADEKATTHQLVIKRKNMLNLLKYGCTGANRKKSQGGMKSDKGVQAMLGHEADMADG